MIEYFSKALTQLPDPRWRGILLRSILIALGLLALVIIAVNLLFRLVPDTGWEFFDSALSWLLGAGSIILGFFLFPLLLTTSQAFFTEGAARAVEDKHYPDLPAVREQPLSEAIGEGLRFLGVSIGLNILVLPLYLIPVVNFFIFYLLNGYLIGREYFDTVAIRRLDKKSVHALRLSHRGKILGVGILLTFFAMIPVVNLLAPLVGIAVMIHLFEDLRRAGGGAKIS